MVAHNYPQSLHINEKNKFLLAIRVQQLLGSLLRKRKKTYFIFLR